MLSRWPIRNKLIFGVVLLLVIVLTMSISSFQGTYAYRNLVRSLSKRAAELPLATALSKQVSNLRVSLAELENQAIWSAELKVLSPGSKRLELEFEKDFEAVREIAAEYREKLAEREDGHEDEDESIGDSSREEAKLVEVEQALASIEEFTKPDNWYLDSTNTSAIDSRLVQLQTLAAELPSYLQHNMHELAREVRSRYRAWIVLTWVCSVAVTGLLVVFFFLCYRWVFRPLRVLVKGSRRVAEGDFEYRIRLDSRDEMAELAAAMNDMTERFRTIRDDLDRQVQLRTKQVVRSEQLASVGFLAAGVAHEINNPLASIALCAESLEGRLVDLAGSEKSSDQVEVVQRYLRMIQTEAFRCKEITEKLLDFSRMGEVKRQSADLRELVGAVIEMVRHLGKYQDRHIEFEPGESVIAPVNAQEIKQVVLNLITNALDSVDSGGTLTIELRRKPNFAEMIFTDNGCGMTEEVLKHLFEPFFTRKRGAQGTGLGLSIVYRIVSEHGGQIEATSAGPGRGSQFHVTLPLTDAQAKSLSKETSHRYQAA